MNPTPPGTLFLLAADHRESLRRALVAVAPGSEPDLRAAKHLIWEGLQTAAATRPAEGLGILVDEETGAEVARAARAAGLVLAMPVERSDQRVFSFEYGHDFGDHLERFGPDLAKVLVRWNPDDDPALKAEQAGPLRQLSDWLQPRRIPLLFELLVPPTPGQLASVGGDRADYDRRLRPSLMVMAIGEIHRAGIEPAVWKLEGLADPADCEAVARAIGTEAKAVVLGRGAPAAQVEDWLRAAAPVPGYAGFTIGRTIWWEALAAWQEGRLSRPEAVEAVAGAYSHYLEVYEAARAAGPQARRRQ